ncbi:GNAT family N-acetyltransferase, partial [Streptomyces sp. 8K308]|uniref:GNAT family N-acetyltransferase n=1 Tax=Streptomyces sp. 8K308 TaxID=2530388 RepID=UPI00104BC4C4
MTIELRGLRDKEWDAWFSGLEWAFGGGVWAPEERALWRELTEIDRSIAAWDRDRIVGSFGSFSFRMTVPGGAVVPTAGVTAVSVAATHRRRGLLRRMMRSALEDIHAAGEPLAVLTASEQRIYGRFGYGVATRAMRASIDTARVRIAPPAGADDLTLSVLPPAEAAAHCEELYARLVPTRPGMLARQPGWEKLPLLDPPANRNGASELRCVLAERDGELMGYARYAMKPHWGEGAIPDGTVLVRDLTAADPAAYGALLRFLFEMDLMSTVVLSSRPVDDPLLHLVSDIRRCDLRIVDRLHLRTVDVGAALAARTYATEVDVVLAVEDELCPWNTGNWRLSGGPLGAVCERTTDPAELSFDVRALGAAYLGDASPLALAGAGLVRELRG